MLSKMIPPRRFQANEQGEGWGANYEPAASLIPPATSHFKPNTYSSCDHFRDLQDEGGEAAMRPEDDRAGSARAVSPPAPFPVAVGDADGAFTTAILTASEASKVRQSMSPAPCYARLDLWTCFFSDVI